ncbi:MAG: hypothetical protein IJ619_07855 [Eubacterium sp.]|nr:hypothetical protein [Eubacterium sp.]
MNREQNPFTHSYGSAGQAYINMNWADKAIDNYSFENPSEYVYKIIGVRGSGKTVVLSDIIKYFREDDSKKKGWIVYDLSSARNPLHTLVSYLANEDFLQDSKKKLKTTIGASIGLITATINTDNSANAFYYDDEVELDKLLNRAFEKGKKILICIDDISKTDDTVAFCSVYAKYIRAAKPIYFICTGLFSNMESLGRVRNLTFFRRADTIEVRYLSDVSVTTKYKKLLNVDIEEARKLAIETKGYAYAYQVLGSLYFNKKPSESLEDLIDEYDEILFTESYEKIWEELTEGERNLIRIILEHKDRATILEQMEKPKNYSELRSSLIKGGIIRETSRGKVDFALPHFEEYVKYYC